MLDKDTKLKLDDCRDILIGKLPNPKSQIEQITIALIYKFMDDMDKEAIELGGKPKFFADYMQPNLEFPDDRSKDKLVEFSKFSWDHLFNSKGNAIEMLQLYEKALEIIENNPNNAHKNPVNWSELKINLDEQWENFIVLFENEHPKFIYRIKVKYPSITAGEIRLLCITRLGLDDVTAASIQGVNVNSVSQTRRRFMRKSNIENLIKLKELIFSI
jgi:DNA-binding CsgD family transcriptional regulator